MNEWMRRSNQKFLTHRASKHYINVVTEEYICSERITEKRNIVKATKQHNNINV